MTEDDARQAVEKLAGARATAVLAQLASLVTEENKRQNLVAASTLPALWARHIWDSIQLLHWAPAQLTSWLDIGTGGGFPGLAIGCAIEAEMILVEPRRRRAEFLAAAAATLGLDHVKIEARKVERLSRQVDVISARAVASVENILRLGRQCATPSTRWLLPRGLMPADELATLRAHWGGRFHVEHSLSADRDSGVILVADGVWPR